MKQWDIIVRTIECHCDITIVTKWERGIFKGLSHIIGEQIYYWNNEYAYIGIKMTERQQYSEGDIGPLGFLIWDIGVILKYWHMNNEVSSNFNKFYINFNKFIRNGHKHNVCFLFFGGGGELMFNCDIQVF